MIYSKLFTLKANYSTLLLDSSILFNRLIMILFITNLFYKTKIFNKQLKNEKNNLFIHFSFSIMEL